MLLTIRKWFVIADIVKTMWNRNVCVCVAERTQFTVCMAMIIGDIDVGTPSCVQWIELFLFKFLYLDATYSFRHFHLSLLISI